MFTVVNDDGGEHIYKRTHVENTAASKACPESFFTILMILKICFGKGTHVKRLREGREYRIIFSI